MIESLFGTLRHFFGNFLVNLKSVKDPREQNRITYPLTCLLFTGILMFLCRLGSRRQIRFSFNGSAAIEKFSLMTEFIENANEKVAKQDSEQKAFFRLACRLKKRFPRLPICLLIDALFAEGPVFSLCQKYNWKFLITLKDSILHSLHEEFEERFLLQPINKATFQTNDQIVQKFRWANEIPYKDQRKNLHLLNIVECTENKAIAKTKFKWVTNLTITNKNFLEISNYGGRLRWKIENEGFNVQKNGGFGLEHAYSRDSRSLKIFYYLLQMAHIFTQLVEKGSLFKKIFPRGLGSSKNLAAKLKEEWIYSRVAASRWDSFPGLSLQIRFNTS